RRWRQVWSDHRLKTLPAREVMALAHAEAPHARQSESLTASA
ncbi:tRNA dihydrouridine(20/20a) synthase DusA, partial [Staphylococcus warneri]